MPEKATGGRMESPAERGAVLLRRRWVRVLLWVALAVVVVMIFVFSAQSGEASGSLSAFLTKFIIRTVEGGEAAEAAQPGVMLFVEKLVRKAAHVTEFALLGFFAAPAGRRLCAAPPDTLVLPGRHDPRGAG